MEYSVALKTGVKGHVQSAPCFGKMASSGWGPIRDIRQPQAVVGYSNRDQHSFIEFSIEKNINNISTWEKNIGGFEFLSSEDLAQTNKRPRAEKNLIKHLQALFEDLEVYKGCISVHPILKVVRAHVKHNQADKIITGLFLARNLTNTPTIANMYVDMINWGYRPSFAAVIAHLIHCNKGAFNNSYEFQWVGETNWISPVTFGNQALLNMIGGTVPEEGFVQGEWVEQGHYQRDGYFSEQGMRFNGRTRCLIDCLSVERDTHLLSNTTNGNRSTNNGNSSACTQLIDHRGFSMPQLVVKMEELLTENNINAFA